MTPLGTASVAVNLPAFSFPPPIFGAKISVHAATSPALAFDPPGPGTVDVGGRSLRMFPFNLIDCLSCGSGGWRELHVLLWDDANTALTFGVLYLFPPSVGRPMQLSYAITLPTLAAPPDEAFDGTWTLTP